VEMKYIWRDRRVICQAVSGVALEGTSTLIRSTSGSKG